MGPDARERDPLPSVAQRLGPIISKVHSNDSTLTRNKSLLVTPFLERFLDSIDFQDPRDNPNYAPTRNSKGSTQKSSITFERTCVKSSVSTGLGNRSPR